MKLAVLLFHYAGYGGRVYSVTFMGGTSGVFYTQFGVTLAIAIVISAVNALTLSPALCAILLKPHQEGHGEKKLSRIDRFHKAFNAAYDVTLNKYKTGFSSLSNANGFHWVHSW